MTDMKRRLSNRSKLRQNAAAWMIMAPSIALFAFFIWVPLLQSVVMSLFETTNITLDKFVGFANYADIFQNPLFGKALVNTLMYTFWSLVIGFLTPIFMALVISEAPRWRGFFRTAAYLPNILPALAAVLLWSAFFSGEESGAINSILALFGAEPTSFLDKSWLVIPLIVLISTWKGAGATALIYMAGLSGINPELYDAAAIDGAGVFRRLRHITLPSIFNLGSTLMILQIIAIFQILYEPMVLTHGGPDNSTLSLMLLMWRYITGGDMDYGKASATGVLIALILLGFTVIYNILNKRKSDSV
ncbi:MAG: sugar ABC transporter permease [Oscillospiraceae bacterium]|jgi:multiple sugar transport system permease protein|nr:sugar ABC transporter permease [Oscillospiraceae bacterium]